MQFHAKTQWPACSPRVPRNLSASRKSPPLGTNRTRKETRTLNATGQSNFLKNRLVRTLGWRRDRRRLRTSLPNAADLSTDLVNGGPLRTWNRPTNAQGEVLRNTQRGETKTFGAGVKPLT